MTHIVSADSQSEIILNPATRDEEILQNVRIILATPKMSCPLDRGLGLRQKFIDKPSPDIAINLLVAEVLDEIEASEPRVKIKNVTYKLGEIPGKIIPVLEVTILAEPK